MGRIRTRVSKFFASFNLIAIWREERRRDREAHILIATELADAIRANAEVSVKALGIVDKFFGNFQASGEPEHYVVRENDEVKEAMKRFEMQDDFSEETDPFRVIY